MLAYLPFTVKYTALLWMLILAGSTPQGMASSAGLCCLASDEKLAFIPFEVPETENAYAGSRYHYTFLHSPLSSL